jgi:hypothetical protein
MQGHPSKSSDACSSPPTWDKDGEPATHPAGVTTSRSLLPGGRRALAATLAGFVAASAAAGLTTTASGAVSTAKANPNLVKLQVLALNDFHGNLAPPSGSSGRIGTVEAGGAAFLATKLDALRAQAAANGAHSITVAAGDSSERHHGSLQRSTTSRRSRR